jgi:hypothetical protein
MVGIPYFDGRGFLVRGTEIKFPFIQCHKKSLKCYLEVISLLNSWTRVHFKQSKSEILKDKR